MTSQSDMKIFHGPENICGAARYLADWQRGKGAISDSITYVENRESHYSLHLDRYDPVSRCVVGGLFALCCLCKYDLFHFYFAKSLLPLNIDLVLLKLLRKKVVMTYCGSDIRLMEIEKERNPYSHLLHFGNNDPRLDQRKRRKMRWQRMWVDRAIALRNSYAPVASVYPEEKIVSDISILNTIDPSFYKPASYETKVPPTVLHAPSEKRIKGTEFIRKAVSELKEEGHVFEYKELHGVPNDDVHRALREDADIVVDQLLLGSFGTFSVEGMFYGKPVLAYLNEGIKRVHFPDCPIVNTNIENLKQDLLYLINNKEEREQLGKEGRSYVERNFDRTKINEQLWELYHSL